MFIYIIWWLWINNILIVKCHFEKTHQHHFRSRPVKRLSNKRHEALVKLWKGKTQKHDPQNITRLGKTLTGALHLTNDQWQWRSINQSIIDSKLTKTQQWLHQNVNRFISQLCHQAAKINWVHVFVEEAVVHTHRCQMTSTRHQWWRRRKSQMKYNNANEKAKQVHYFLLSVTGLPFPACSSLQQQTVSSLPFCIDSSSGFPPPSSKSGCQPPCLCIFPECTAIRRTWGSADVLMSSCTKDSTRPETFERKTWNKTE